MGNSFDIRVEALANPAASVAKAPAAAAQDAARGTFFLETFGCQMNEHDPEKGAGLLMARGYQQGETPEAAALGPFQQSPIRGGGAHKVFSHLGPFRGPKGHGYRDSPMRF